jgi:ubiquinone/menaquinone biosynthesis C-methylase UbiE
MHDILNWLEETADPQLYDSASFIYEDMASQSGESLPLIYQPFDVSRQAHWRDRGAALDYLLSTRARGQRVLDFGPGDGWPSLIVAPQVASVTGVDASPRRVQVCTSNAARLGIDNATFLAVPPGQPLPFAAGSFDAAVAASSVEQTPDPYQTLAELYRVLRPGGRLRLSYEALSRYRGGEETAVWLFGIDEQTSRLILYDRQIEQERVVQYGLTFHLSAADLGRQLTAATELTVSDITPATLKPLAGALLDVRKCVTGHPSGPTLATWLAQIGFSQVRPTHNGLEAAAILFEQTPANERPQTVTAVDTYLEPFVKMVIGLAAPLEMDPMITAVK